MGRATDDESHSVRFRRLFADHQRAVLGYALRRAQTPTDALDVVAETFLVAWRRIDVVPGRDDARPWLLSVARRVLANQRLACSVGTCSCSDWETSWRSTRRWSRTAPRRPRSSGTHSRSSRMKIAS
jgi:hypothetical protein